jgi:metal-sulfur cluster biosynthetic enzyme
VVPSSPLPRCEFADGCEGAVILERLGQVLDPELDEPILQLGFVRSLQVRHGHAVVALQLPTSWCAVNFAWLIAEDVRRALTAVDGIGKVTVDLGDHCAAAQIEAAVNGGKTFAQAFPGEGFGSLAALRQVFLRKGFLGRQERLLRELRAAGCSPAAICALRLCDALVESGSAETLQRYLERRAELGLDCSPSAPLIIDLDGNRLSVERLEAHYRDIRTVRVAMEANGSFCRALLASHRLDERTGGNDVPA